MKKQRLSKSDLVTPQIDKTEFQQSGNLPNKEAADFIVSSVTNVPLDNPTSESKSYGRPKKTAAIGREPFTTSMQNYLVRRLKEKALREGMTVADLLEKMLIRYLNE